jgi:parvulin-like peptidyl-prolyl isomerase
MRRNLFYLLPFFLLACEEPSTSNLPANPTTQAGEAMPAFAKVGRFSIHPWEFNSIITEQEKKIREAVADPKEAQEYLAELKINVSQSLLASGVFAVEAEKRGLKASKEEIDKVWESFAKNPEKRPKEASEQQLRETIERELLAKKGVEALRAEVTLSEEELIDLFRKTFTERSFAYILFDAVQLEHAITVTPGEVAAFQKANPSNIESWYKSHPQDFVQKAARKIRHILIKRTEGEDKARALLEAAAKRLDAGEDFAKIAQEVSQDVSSASKGGDLGWVEQGQMGRAFEDAAWKLSKGQRSQVVSTPFGLHLVLVEDMRDESPRPLSEVSGSIAETLARQDKAHSLAQVTATEILAAAKAGKSLTEALQGKSFPVPLSVKNTGVFPEKAEAIPGLGRNKDMLDAAFALTMKEPLPQVPLQVGESLLVIQLLSRKDADMKPLEDPQQKAALRAEILKARQREKIENFALERIERGEGMLRNPSFFQSHHAH